MPSINSIWQKFTNSRETKAIALTEELKAYKLAYREDSNLIDDVSIVIVSIEDDLILAVNFKNYVPKKQKAEIIVLDNNNNKKGILYIKQQDTISVEDKQVYFYKITGARSHLPYLYSILMNHIVYGAKKKSGYKLKEGKRLHDLFVYYIKARPAFLLSVKDGNDFDIFPADLNGNIFDDYYTQAIKSTNKSIALIKRTKTFCLSEIPYSKADLIYKHHDQRRREKIGLSNLTFPVSESKVLKIPVPDFATNVKEFDVVTTFKKSGYTVFLLKCRNQYTLSNEPAFAHMPWYSFPRA